MKHRQVILGAVAFIVTAASAWAFKTNTNKKVLYATLNQHQSSCAVTNCFTTANTTAGNAVCQTAGTGIVSGHQFFTTVACNTTHQYTGERQITN